MYNIDEKIENLKKQIRDKKAEIQQSKSSTLDKFTNIDDILRKSQEILHNIENQLNLLNQSVLLSNRIAYAIYNKEVIKSGNLESIKIEGIESLYESFSRSKFIHLTNISTSEVNERIYSIDGNGYIVEIVFLSSDSSSDNNSYSVKITSGNEIIANDSWSNFSTGSNYNTDITAFDDTDNEYYVLHFKDFYFKDNLIIELYDCSATFSEINIKYHI